MMIYPVEVYGSPVLRKKSVDIEKDFPGLAQLISDMFETMYKADGMGLAAPQIGKNIRLIVIDATALAEDNPDVSDFKIVLINPIILNRMGEISSYAEGCLSLPGIREEVKRPSEIEIEYYDENFIFHKEKFDGLKARIIQHEYDHIEGILFIDHISALRRKLLRAKLNAITKGEVEVRYKIKIPAKSK